MRFILLKTYSNYVEANIDITLLEDKGINCHLENEATSSLLGLGVTMKLMVYASQAERAAEIILSVEKEYLGTIVCPACKQTGFEIEFATESHEKVLRRMPFGRWLANMSNLLTKEGTTIRVKKYVCLSCKQTYNELPS